MKICPLANMKWSNSCWLRIMNKKIRALFGGSQRTSLFTVIKYFFYKKTGNIKLFPVNLHNDYCHSFNDTNNSGSIVPCETSKPNMVGQMFGSQLEADLTLQNGPGKWFSRTSNGFRTMSLLGGGIVWKLQKCTNQTRLDTKNSGWRKMPLIQE